MELDQMCNVLLSIVAMVCVFMAWRIDVNRSSENSREKFKRELNKK